MSLQNSIKDHDAPTRDECWSLLERVAESSHLTRATRLREFLFYVGHKSIKENSTEIHEQEIGQLVFGRDESYDTGQDNIVRVNATKLRSRIEDYFKNEGLTEPIVFEIPRGSYLPVFRRRTAEEIEVPEPVAPVVVQAEAPRFLPRLLTAMLIVLVVLCSMLWMRDLTLSRENEKMSHLIHAWEGHPALADFWPHFFNTPQQTNIILADTSFTLIEDILKRPISLSDYLDRSYINSIKASSPGLDRNVLEMLLSRNNGSFGDFRVAQQIQSLDTSASNISVVYARDYTVDAIKHNNVILIGSPRSNPWVEMFSENRNFAIEYDPRLNQSYITNLHPQAGEQAKYSVPPSTQGGPLGYSVIAYLPNPTHTANALIIAGTTSEATNAAGDFLISESSMSNFLQKIHAKQFPYFEILLKTARLSGTPISAEVIAYRTY